jgi:hypothetical protein
LPFRTSDELHAAPALATLPALSACISAFITALDVVHPDLLNRSQFPLSERESAATMLHMLLDTCQCTLREYDRLTFEDASWHDDEPEPGPADDFPF